MPEDKRILVGRLPQLRDALRSALDDIRALGIEPPERGRLADYASALDSVIAAGSYPDSKDELSLLGEAILTARDFRDIAAGLPPTISSRLAQELAAATTGSTQRITSGGSGRQFQTQFWFGAVMQLAGLSPRVPATADGPDFIVRPNALDYGVEVKRPTSRRGAFDALRKARHQLSRVGNGVVVMDLSDCLDDIGLRRFGPIEAGPVDYGLAHEYREFGDRLSGIVWDWHARSYRRTFTSVFALWIFARGCRWDLTKLIAPELIGFQGMHRYCSTAGNVWCHKADEFMRKILASLEDGGLHIHLADQESPTPIARPFFDDLW